MSFTEMRSLGKENFRKGVIKSFMRVEEIGRDEKRVHTSIIRKRPEDLM